MVYADSSSNSLQVVDPTALSAAEAMRVNQVRCWPPVRPEAGEEGGGGRQPPTTKTTNQPPKPPTNRLTKTTPPVHTTTHSVTSRW